MKKDTTYIRSSKKPSTTKWTWQNDLVSVPPKNSEEDYQLVPKKEAARIYQERMLNPKYLAKIRGTKQANDKDGLASFTTSEVSVEARRPTKSKPNESKSTGRSKGELVESLTGTPKKKSARLNVDTSIVDLLKSLGEDSSFGARKKMAEEYGIGPDYTGTSSQNMNLMSKVRAGRSPAEPPVESPSEPSMPASRKGSAGTGVDVPVSVDSEDITNVDSQLLEQNRDYLTAEDFRNGAWDAYVAFVKKTRLKNPMRATNLPNFQEYTRVSEAGI